MRFRQWAQIAAQDALLGRYCRRLRKGYATGSGGYEESETCYLLEGEVIVTPDGGQPIKIGPSDLVTFPAGLSCTWDVRAPVRKHYQFG